MFYDKEYSYEDWLEENDLEEDCGKILKYNKPYPMSNKRLFEEGIRKGIELEKRRNFDDGK